MVMERLKRTFSFRKSKRKDKNKVPESSKPHQWQEDERKVRDGTCSFQVWYLGGIEVFESRGMQVCEEASKVLKTQCKGKYQRAVLYVSGDALRVVDEISKNCKKAKRLSFRKKRKGHRAVPAILYISGDSLRVAEDRPGTELSFMGGGDDQAKGLIVDQTVEKVSFCAPDRNHEKGFAYICRDGTTRRWMCHGFLALKESGERLSHAVGCAFAICLERKQKRDKESGVTVQYSEDKTSFTRTGSFRQTTLTERLADPQSAIVPEPVSPVAAVGVTQAAVETKPVQRPHATQDMLYRQGSFRGFSKLQEAASPFKRQLSLRLNELPSTLQRQSDCGGVEGPGANGPASPIAEVSPSKERAEENADSIAALCQELTSGLSALSSDDPFATVPKSPTTTPQHTHQTISSVHSTPVHQQQQQQNINPWAQHSATPSADFWLSTSLTQTASPTPATQPTSFVNGNSSFMGAAVPAGFHGSPQPHHYHHHQMAVGHARSHSIDSSDLFSSQRKPTLSELARQNTVQNGTSAFGPSTNQWQTSSASHSQTTTAFDPFDAAWATRKTNTTSSVGGGSTTNPTNPFASPGSTKAFEVKL